MMMMMIIYDDDDDDDDDDNDGVFLSFDFLDPEAVGLANSGHCPATLYSSFWSADLPALFVASTTRDLRDCF
jgi:hypothetical protein